MDDYDSYEASIKQSYQAIRVAKKQAKNMTHKMKSKYLSQDTKLKIFISQAKRNSRKSMIQLSSYNGPNLF